MSTFDASTFDEPEDYARGYRNGVAEQLRIDEDSFQRGYHKGYMDALDEIATGVKAAMSKPE